jgi:hypothetical protein
MLYDGKTFVDKLFDLEEKIDRLYALVEGMTNETTLTAQKGKGE